MKEKQKLVPRTAERRTIKEKVVRQRRKEG